MVKIDSDHGKTTVACTGPMADVVVDLGAAIANIYGQIRKANPDAAEEFRRALLCMLEPDSPVWSHNPPLDPDAYTVVIPIKKNK